VNKQPIEAELLVNVASRRALEAYDEVLAACKQNDIHLTKVTRLSQPQNLSSVLKKIVSRKPRLLIVGSGDGTVSGVVDELANTAIELGIIPLGTTNNFARSLGLPLSINAAVKHLATARARKVDLGLINDDYFANVAGIGLSAEIAATIPNSLKKRYGRAAYAIHGLKLMMRHKPFNATITDINNKLALNVKTHQLIVANGTHHAGAEIATDTAVDSNELVVFKLGGSSRLSLIWHMIDFYIGRRRTVANTSYLIAKDITIKTNRSVTIELDGEAKERTPAAIKVQASVLRVRY